MRGLEVDEASEPVGMLSTEGMEDDIAAGIADSQRLLERLDDCNDVIGSALWVIPGREGPRFQGRWESSAGGLPSEWARQGRDEDFALTRLAQANA